MMSSAKSPCQIPGQSFSHILRHMVWIHGQMCSKSSIWCAHDRQLVASTTSMWGAICGFNHYIGNEQHKNERKNEQKKIKQRTHHSSILYSFFTLSKQKIRPFFALTALWMLQELFHQQAIQAIGDECTYLAQNWQRNSLVRGSKMHQWSLSSILKHLAADALKQSDISTCNYE